MLEEIKGFGSGSCHTSFDRQREAIVDRGARTHIVITATERVLIETKYGCVRRNVILLS